MERIEAGGTLKILDVLFVGSDASSGELFAVDLHGSGAGGMIAPLLGFRLDVSERRRVTERTLARPDGPVQLIRDLGETLAPGDAVAAVLIAHRWAHALADAVERTGGTAIENTFVESTSIAELADVLLSATGGGAT